MTEKQLQSSIIEYLNYSGKCYVWNVNSGSIKINTDKGSRFFKGAPTGHSDIQGIHRDSGKFIAIEVKLPKRKKYVTDMQQEFLDKVTMFGGIAGVATTPEEAMQIIEGK